MKWNHHKMQQQKQQQKQKLLDEEEEQRVEDESPKTMAFHLVPCAKTSSCSFLAASVAVVEEFYYITDNTYFKEEVLQKEFAVLNYLKFEMSAPTIKCFLRRIGIEANERANVQ
ncbi:hypothetical protein PIB30_070290 [Stylosanthes scabra]|uniref:B-like cyclin n=1 Tax=Stylosanthes scabra TaxID=79078 RepID=A0ABU6ZM46_9FABA|nr:hypothetical protein [Stylosanthes scabra]